MAQKENEMTDETTTVCTICGGGLVRGLHAARTTHISLRTCIKTLRARAEAAENGLADLTERHENEMAKLIALVPSLRQRAEKAETRLAELEAAARWRPVSERPPNDAPVLALLESGEYKVARYVVVGDINGVPLHHWRGTGGTSKHVAYWRPITEEAPPGDMAQKENDEMIDEQEAEQRRLVEIIAELLNDEDNTITDRSEKRALIARIAALREFNRWRPVSETPTHDKPVLALLESGEYKVVRYVALGNVNGVLLHHWRGTGGPDKHVAHWRPITEEAPAE